MSDVRFETSEDTMNDCLTVTDNEDKLKTGFDGKSFMSLGRCQYGIYS